jgi:hypothetical protein
MSKLSFSRSELHQVKEQFHNAVKEIAVRNNVIIHTGISPEGEIEFTVADNEADNTETTDPTVV